MTLTRSTWFPADEDDQADDGHAREAESAAARFGRWLRGAPADRIPPAAMPVVWTAAEIMHATGVSGAFTGAAALAAAGTAFGLGERHQGGPHSRLRGAELAALAGGVGAWATAATMWGPLAGPAHLLTLVYVTGCAAGYWWLRTHEAIRSARDRRTAAAAEAAQWLARRAEWHRLAARTGLQGSHLIQKPERTQNSNGETWLIDTYSTGRLASQIDCRQLDQRLAGERGDRINRVEVTADPEWPYRLRILFREDDPWKGGSPDAFIWHPWASGGYDPSAPFADLVPPGATIRDPVVIGADPELGTPLQVPLWDGNGAKRVLVIAASGQGKSMLLDDIRERVTACEDARLIQVNLSKGVEDAWWQPLTEASALASDPNPPAKAQAIIDFATAAVKARPNAPARKTGGRRSHQPTPDEPLFVFVIDEYDVVAQDPARKAAVETLASKCRSEGWALVLATQRPVGAWVSTSLKANLTNLVWSKMRAGDMRHAAGNEKFELPDMGAYGGGNAGIFGVCEHPTYPGMPYLRGRTFFWGDESPGLTRLIAARAAGRRPYVLEPALAPLAGQWAQITGAAPLDAARYDVTTTSDGQTVPGMEGPRAKFAAVRDLLNGTRHARDEDDRQAGAEDPGDADDARARVLALRSRPGGFTRLDAEAATGAGKTKTWQIIAALMDEGLLARQGDGPATRYHWPRLHAVPDPGEAAGSAS
jgi:hypothetical protein